MEQIAADVESFELICQKYQSFVNKMVTFAVPGGTLVIELRSRATLVTWAIACLVERLVRRLHPQLEKYEMALCFTDLWLLSLSDGLAHSALASVCAYLRPRTSNGKMKRPVFSQLSGDETERLAEEVGHASLTIKAAWETETGHADRRRDVHWAEMLRKQALALQLRARLQQETAELCDAQAKLKHEFAPDAISPGKHTPDENNVQYGQNQRLVQVVSRCQGKVSGTAAELEAAEQSPPQVIQVLPSNESSVYAVLCFMYMDKSLRSLANL